jgi:hypothetical protein
LMKDKCELCGKALAFLAEAYICSYECTYCPECTAKLGKVCKTCGGELVLRPRRKEKEV